jgi:hypothetical protein
LIPLAQHARADTGPIRVGQVGMVITVFYHSDGSFCVKARTRARKAVVKRRAIPPF